MPGEVVLENYSFSGLSLKIFGYDMVNFSSFGFDHACEVELTYGKSGEIVGYTRKNYKRNLKVSINFEEMEKLVTLAIPFGGLLEKLPPCPLVGRISAQGRPDFTYTAPLTMISKYNADFKNGSSGAVEVPLEMQLLSIPILAFV
ncbi:MAG: hypothetical protein HS129_15050 [Leptospiraceae bacterium]|nr:hypothetical protein [Leptospiraceae bacterium]